MQHHQTLLRSTARSPAASARSSRGVPDAATWDHPAPVAGWTARDVVRHLLDWFPGFLQAGAGTALPADPSPDDAPVAAWTTFNDGVQAMLDDPASQDRTFTNPHTGSLPLPLAISRFFTADLFMHTLGSGPRHRPERDSWTPSAARRCSRAWSQWRIYRAGARSTDRASKSLRMPTRRLN